MAAPRRRRVIPKSRAKKVAKKPPSKPSPRRRVIPKSRAKKSSTPLARQAPVSSGGDVPDQKLKPSTAARDLADLKLNAMPSPMTRPSPRGFTDPRFNAMPSPTPSPMGRGFADPRFNAMPSPMSRPMSRPMNPLQQSALRNLFTNYNKAINTGYTRPLSNSRYNSIFGSMFGRKP
jgi:hypothetical protein